MRKRETAWLTAASKGYIEIDKKILGSRTTTLIISNQEMKDFMKIVKSLEEYQGTAQIIETWTKKRSEFLSLVLSKLGASLFTK